MGLKIELLGEHRHSDANRATGLAHDVPLSEEPRILAACRGRCFSQVQPGCMALSLGAYKDSSQVLLGPSWEWLPPGQHQQSAAEGR